MSSSLVLKPQGFTKNTPEKSVVAQSSINPVCRKCNGQIRRVSLCALGETWCPEHFTCSDSSCNMLLQGQGYKEVRGQPYCKDCWGKSFAEDCGKCNKKILGNVFKAIGQTYHPECFVCSHCGKKIEDKSFIPESNLPYCEDDWNKFFATKCASCELAIKFGEQSGLVKKLNARYHHRCLNCSECKTNLAGQRFAIRDGKPFCTDHN